MEFCPKSFSTTRDQARRRLHSLSTCIRQRCLALRPLPALLSRHCWHYHWHQCDNVYVVSQRNLHHGDSSPSLGQWKSLFPPNYPGSWAKKTAVWPELVMNSTARSKHFAGTGVGKDLLYSRKQWVCSFESFQRTPCASWGESEFDRGTPFSSPREHHLEIRCENLWHGSVVWRNLEESRAKPSPKHPVFESLPHETTFSESSFHRSSQSDVHPNA